MRELVIKAVQRVIKPTPPLQLGRWQLNNTEEIIEKTIERANEDHCGTCVNPPKKEIKSTNQ